MWGADPLHNDDTCRIVNERHFDRLQRMLGDGETALGGTSDRASLRIAPTVLTGIADDAPVMQEEIFGPILPIVEVPDERAAIARVAAHDKPLCVYVFTAEASSRRAWLRGTSSGAVGFDVPVLHLGVPGIPFGGVGASGTGSYHGRRSLEAFSHEKAVFVKPARPDTMRLLQPPYRGRRAALLRRLAPGGSGR
jgi:aldehyde dehydrogenase (NAD+)